jgi:hypothetical protein
MFTPPSDLKPYLPPANQVAVVAEPPPQPTVLAYLVTPADSSIAPFEIAVTNPFDLQIVPFAQGSLAWKKFLPATCSAPINAMDAQRAQMFFNQHLFMPYYHKPV